MIETFIGKQSGKCVLTARVDFTTVTEDRMYELYKNDSADPRTTLYIIKRWTPAFSL